MTKKRKKSDERDYDRQRFNETEKKLNEGVRALRKKKEYSTGKPITEYALWKQTGVSRRTIKNHPNIVKLLNEEKYPVVNLKTAKVNVDRIHTMEQAVSTIEQLETLYNNLTVKYNDAMKANSELNMQMVELQDELNELNRVLKQREANDSDASDK